MIRSFAPLAAALLLVACNAASDEPLPPEGKELDKGVQPMGPGLYAVGDGSQVYVRTRLATDGTYQDLDPSGAVVGSGSWSSLDEVICFDPAGDGEEQQERCWSNSPPDEDGSFLTTRDDGSESYRVTPLEE